jgi:LemA protein
MTISTSTIVLVLIGLIVAWAIFTYNRFIKLVNRVKEAWSGIDVQLKRRFNLIPNLIQTVKGYAKHETEVLEKLTETRAGSQDVNQRGVEEGHISRAIANLFAVAEAYPDLKASQNFLDLQNSLTTVENEIQMSRRYYNGSVRDLNILVESFPSNLIARYFGFATAEFFEIELASQRDVPKVEF